MHYLEASQCFAPFSCWQNVTALAAHHLRFIRFHVACVVGEGKHYTCAVKSFSCMYQILFCWRNQESSLNVYIWSFFSLFLIKRHLYVHTHVRLGYFSFIIHMFISGANLKLWVHTNFFGICFLVSWILFWQSLQIWYDIGSSFVWFIVINLSNTDRHW